MSNIILEICCASVADAVEAEKGGADRVELCSALYVGGLTPSIGLILEAKARLTIPVMAMVRPRPAGFCYTPTEMDVMIRDTEAALNAGADGIVFGTLHSDGTVDVERSRRICDLIGRRESVFHRAFDVTPDPFRALDELIDLGITRVLTSGQRSGAPEGADLIKRLIDHARDRIEILPGAGIRVQMIQNLVKKTGCRQVHMTAFRSERDSSTGARTEVTFNGSVLPVEDRYEVTDTKLVQQIVREIRSLIAENAR